jgi:hypothetical protein
MAFGLNILNNNSQILVSDKYKGLALKGVFTPQEFGPNTYFNHTILRRSTMTVITDLQYTGTEMIFVYSADGSPVSVDCVWQADNLVFDTLGGNIINSTAMDVVLPQWTRFRPQPQPGMSVSFYNGPYATISSVSWNEAEFNRSRVRLNFSSTISSGGSGVVAFRSPTFTGRLVVTIGTDGIQNNVNNYKVLVFDTITGSATGYGAAVFNSSGQLTFSTANKMLAVSALGVVPALPSNTVVSISSLQNSYSVAPLFGNMPAQPAFLNSNLGRQLNYSNQDPNNPYGGAVRYGLAYNRIGNNFAPFLCGAAGGATSNSSSLGAHQSLSTYAFGGSTFIMAIDASKYL